MRIGIAIQETWAFFAEIEAELSLHHKITQFRARQRRFPVFNERIQRRMLRQDWQRFLEENDVVFFEWASGMLETATHLPKTCGIVTRLHRYEMYKWADQINWEAVDRVILVSRAKQREFARRFPDHADRTVVIPEAVPLERFSSQIKEFSGQIGILCHLSPRKRVYELILAFYELNCLRPGFHLHVGGGKHPGFPDYFDALHSLVEDLGLQKNVTFYGNVQDAQNWYRNIDIFISNSYSEGLQVSPMEAVASGCYALSHRWDGADEFFPENELFYTERQLIEKILAYAALDQVDQRSRIEYLQEIVRENHDIKRIKVQIRQVVEEVGSRYLPQKRHRE